MTTSNKRRAIVIGGSLGGLFASTMLRYIGWDVDVFERSPHDLDSRGGGIVLQPRVVELLQQIGIELTAESLGVMSRYRTVFRPDGSIQSKQMAPQTQTSWSLLYGMLRQSFGQAHYHQDATLAHVEQDVAAGTVSAHFTDGNIQTAHLLIGADGGNSTVRRQFWPLAQPKYAGYLAWRGLVSEHAMPPAAREMLYGDFGFAHNKGSHILGYLVPGTGNDTQPGRLLYNWVWYRVADTSMLNQIMIDRNGHSHGHAMPEGMLADRWINHLRDEAKAMLPLPFREVVEATETPFAQEIRDLASDNMVAGRVIILGDAAAIPRPHTAASTSKAAANALSLAAALLKFADMDKALAHWEEPQVRLGKRLLEQGSSTGDYLMFHRAIGDQ